MNKNIAGGLVILVVVILGIYFLSYQNLDEVEEVRDGAVESGEDASSEDGSASDETARGTGDDTEPKPNVQGRVLLGPTCPAVRVGDDSCAPRSYQTTVRIYRSGQTEVYRLIDSDENGEFQTTLLPGEYRFEPEGGEPFPFCDEESAVIRAGEVQEVTLSCDTGIR